jgi:hypothetical protein
VSEWLTQLNDWILQHSALIVSAGLPIFGAAIAAWQAYLNYRLKKSELRLQARMMLAEQRLKHFKFSKAIDHVHLKDWTDDSSSEFVQLRELCGEVLRAERNRLESDFEEVF